MPDTDEAGKPINIQVTEHKPPRIVRSDKYVSLYVNQAEIGFSAWDIQISLVQVHGRTPDMVGEELATVIMSPQHAKALVIPLISTVIQYEENHGLIPVPGQTHIPLADLLTQTADKIKALNQQAAAGKQGKETEPPAPKPE